MLSADFEQLKEFILAKNSYISYGFANAFKDAAANAIYVKSGSDMQCLLPNDVLGNYFYLRNDAGMKHEAQMPERVTDSGTQRLSFLDTITVNLVAIVNDADAYKLIANLRNTAMQYEAMNVQPIASNWNREQIITDELAKMKSDDVAAVLQRLRNETIVRLTLQVSKIFIPSNCITDPFKTNYYELL
jgi:hypothetical protein